MPDFEAHGGLRDEMVVPATAHPPSPEEFCHEALFYQGDAGFLENVVPFVRGGLEAEEPVLVVLCPERIRALRGELGDDADAVRFADMSVVGSNPARIIPEWRAFITEHAAGGSRVRGIGEPISAARTPDELVECQRHESLLNVAFAGTAPWWLLCPYDTAALDADVVAEARRSHPFVMEDGAQHASGICRDLATMAQSLDAVLPEPTSRPFELVFESVESLPSVRDFVAAQAHRGGFSPAQTADVVLAVNEVVTNSLRHGGGRGSLSVWWDGDALVCEVQDPGSIVDPLVGRERPNLERGDGRGLWIANQVCDLVQLRTTAGGNVVRIHKRPPRVIA